MHRSEDFNADLSVDQVLSRLRHAALASAWVFVVACWCVSFAVSSLFSGHPLVGLLALSTIGVAISAPAAVDAVVRLSHCQLDDTRWPDWLVQLGRAQAFRPVPVHMVEDGGQPALQSIACRLHELGDVRAFARELRFSEVTLRRVDALNLRILADLRLHQLKAGQFVA